MPTVEFHCHTRYSKDSLVDLRALLRTCDRKGIDKAFITDHNTIAGALMARDLAPDRLLIGEEIMTLQGELLAFFLQHEVPAGLPAQSAIDLLRAQAAFISVSHPFDTLREGHWDPSDLLTITPQVDAIEVYNSRCLSPRFNEHATQFAGKHHLLGTVGSDAHSLGEVGASTMALPEFHDAASLKLALTQSRSLTRLSPFWVHFYSRYASWRKRLFPQH